MTDLGDSAMRERHKEWYEKYYRRMAAVSSWPERSFQSYAAGWQAASLSAEQIEELARLLEQRQKLKTKQIAEHVGLAMVHTSLTEQEFAGVLREYLGGQKK